MCALAGSIRSAHSKARSASAARPSASKALPFLKQPLAQLGSARLSHSLGLALGYGLLKFGPSTPH
jgi:hypothetical protein